MFVPLEPQEEWPKPCSSREHFPPTHIFIPEPTKWVCPDCGQETIVYSPQVIC